MKRWLRVIAFIVSVLMIWTVAVGCTSSKDPSSTTDPSDSAGISQEPTDTDLTGGTDDPIGTNATDGEETGAGNNSNGTGKNTTGNNKAQTTTSGSKTPVSTTTTTKNPPAPVTEKKLTGKLELQIFVNGSDNNVVWENTINAFEAANPDLKVTTRIGPNVNSQNYPRWQSGNPSDVVLIAGNLDPMVYIGSGLFADLTNFMKTATVYGSSEKIWDKLKPDVLTYHSGKLYEAPTTLSGYGLWYDEAFFTQKNLTAPRNYQDLVALAPKAQAANVGAITFPGKNADYLVWSIIMPAIAAYGKDFFNQVCTKTPVNVYKSADFKAVWQRLIDYRKINGSFMSGAAGLNHIESQMAWLQHRGALMASGSWLESEMKSNIPKGFNMKFTAASLATSSQKETAILMPYGVAVAEKAKNKDNALTFVRYLYRDEALIGMMESYGFLSACKVDTSKAKLSPAIKSMMEYYNNINVINKTVVLNEKVSTEMINVTNAIVMGDITSADVACDRIYAAATR